MKGGDVKPKTRNVWLTVLIVAVVLANALIFSGWLNK